jgi:prepilin-type N-terminal cleavage/methylation domain-containing protein
MRSFTKFHRGFTVLEMTVTLGVVAVLTGIAVTSAKSMRNKAASSEEARALVQELRYARMYAAQTGVPHGVFYNFAFVPKSENCYPGNWPCFNGERYMGSANRWKAKMTNGALPPAHFLAPIDTQSSATSMNTGEPRRIGSGDSTRKSQRVFYCGAAAATVPTANALTFVPNGASGSIGFSRAGLQFSPADNPITCPTAGCSFGNWSGMSNTTNQPGQSGAMAIPRADGVNADKNLYLLIGSCSVTGEDSLPKCASLSVKQSIVCAPNALTNPAKPEMVRVALNGETKILPFNRTTGAYEE